MLLAPMQARMNRVTINNCPSFLALEDNSNNHSVLIPDLNLKIKLNLHRVISYFPVCKPTNNELEILLIANVTLLKPE